jgi:phage terminase large subunit-like protein
MSVLPRFWVPKETALERQRRGNVPYHDWIQRGLMIGTEGNAIDFDFIRKDVNEFAKRYAIQELAIDRLFNAHQISVQLAGDGVKMIPFGQGYFSMSAPSKQLETLLLHSKIIHGGNEVLRWMASNVSKEENAAGDIKPSKDKSGDKIDGITALVMAVGRLMVNDVSGSVYNQRGLVLL